MVKTVMLINYPEFFKILYNIINVFTVTFYYEKDFERFLLGLGYSIYNYKRV